MLEEGNGTGRDEKDDGVLDEAALEDGTGGIM
jgi:hypothetical protein